MKRVTPLACIFVLGVALGAVGLQDQGEEKLIGWQGDNYAPDRRTWVQTLSWRPRSFLFRNFLSTPEAKHIAETAWPRMKRSTGEYRSMSPCELYLGICIIKHSNHGDTTHGDVIAPTKALMPCSGGSQWIRCARRLPDELRYIPQQVCAPDCFVIRFQVFNYSDIFFKDWFDVWASSRIC